jgi:predicted ribosomally synthesized peptide with SipW-like signal peptide
MMKKNLALTLSALALTAVVTVGGTLAYLSDVTETAQK